MAGAKFDPGPDGHHDDLTLDELDGLTLAVPDDARALDGDREQWLDEEQDTQRPPRVGSGRPPRRKTRLVLTAAIIAASMLVAAISGAVGALVFPRPTSTPPAVPLATDIGPAGQIGGLLPEVTLTADDRAVSARSLRPAVIALIPDDCADCSAWLADVRRQATEFGLRISLVVSPDQAAAGVDLVHNLGSVGVSLFVDPNSALSAAFGADDRALILVRDDGVVTNVLRDPDPGLRLESQILPLNQSLTS